MLPFLNPKKTVTTIIAKRGKPSAEIKPEVEAGESDGLHSVAEEILRAIESKSAADLKAALKSFVEMCDPDEDDEAGE